MKIPPIKTKRVKKKAHQMSADEVRQQIEFYCEHLNRLEIERSNASHAGNYAIGLRKAEDARILRFEIESLKHRHARMVNK